MYYECYDDYDYYSVEEELFCLSSVEVLWIDNDGLWRGCDDLVEFIIF